MKSQMADKFRNQRQSPVQITFQSYPYWNWESFYISTGEWKMSVVNSF